MEDLKNYNAVKSLPIIGEAYRFGGYGGLINDLLLPSMIWRPYMPKYETQLGIYVSTQACVSFSGTTIVEAIFKFKIKNNLLPKDDIDWLRTNGYFDEDGEINFSDRFTAFMSGTDKDGNSGYNVAVSMQKDGLVPEKLHPFPNRQRTPVFDWEDYYSNPSLETIELGKEFARRFFIGYEHVVGVENFDNALQYSPLMVFVDAWYKDSDGLYFRPQGNGFNHAVVKDTPEYEIADSLSGDYFKKLTNDDYNFNSVAYKFGVTSRLINYTMDLQKYDGYLVQLVEGTGGAGVVAKNKAGKYVIITDPNVGKILLTWHIRNTDKNDIDYIRTSKKTMTLAEWNSCEKVTLDWQPIQA
jgi:hypothetical protein